MVDAVMAADVAAVELAPVCMTAAVIMSEQPHARCKVCSWLALAPFPICPNIHDRPSDARYV